MTENKRFTITQDFEEHHRQIRDNGHIIMGCFIEPQAEVIVDFLNQLNDENEKLKSYTGEMEDYLARLEEKNEQLKSKNRGLQSELQIFKEDATHSNLQINKLADENEQLKSIIDKLTIDNTKMKKVLNTTKKENEHIKNTIQEAYETERTHIGKNTLKQLMEAIQ